MRVYSERRRVPRADDPCLVGRRAAARARVALPALIETLNGRQSINLINLSRTGAQLEVPHLPSVGHDVLLKCQGIDVLGMVVWAADGHCGIHFDAPLDEATVIHMRSAGDEAARLGMGHEEKQAALDWVNGRSR